MKLTFLDVDDGAVSTDDHADCIPLKSSRLSWTRAAGTPADVAPGEYIVLAVSYEVSAEGMRAHVHLRNARLVSPLR